MPASLLRRRTLNSIGALAAALAMLASGAPARAASEIVLGQVVPLSGVIAATGAEYVAGAQAYFAQVNAKGGVNGHRIRVVVKDDGYKPDETLRVTRELLQNEKPVALFGFIGTGNVMNLVKNKVLSDARIALLAPFTGAIDLREPPNPNIFHIRASYTDEAAKMVEHLHSIGVRRFAVMYQNDGFGKSGLAGAESALDKLGLKAVATGSYDRTKPEEVDEAAGAIAAGNPEAVIMVSVNKASAAFVKKLRAAGSRAQLFSISVVNVKELVKNTGQELTRGVGVAQVMPYPFVPTTPVAREFLAAMKQYQPDQVVSYTSMESFIAAKVMVEALRRAGPDAGRERIAAALEGIRDFDVGGFTIGFGPGQRVGSKYVEVTVIGAEGRLLR
jgi:ABC-type branched-subunit amino acid transport system substrate-binding protein